MIKDNEITNEVNRRKTFAIISHPDAGKTTLTEKLLLYGGAIRLAGTVKGRKAKKYAVSDWMEIEKQRGISVTSSVMNFDYLGYRFNILDTPGHQDFSEDTYRTLTAADSAVMLIDGAKGVEEQTKKLFHVCRMRKIPIFTFVNKIDRFSKKPFELLEEIEETLGIRACLMSWPIGDEGSYRGVYNRKLSQIELLRGNSENQNIITSDTGDEKSQRFRDYLGDSTYHQFCEDIALLDIAGDAFNMEKILSGELTPMFFGSAMTNVGVQSFLEEFINIAPSPSNKNLKRGMINADDNNFSGFVFKIQANMNPAHRDRIAFIRICSGKFERGIEVFNERIGKKIRLSQPQQFFAQDRTIVEEAFAGDVIGVFDPGIFNIGDTLCEEKNIIEFEDIPIFPAEHFATVMAKDAGKRKQFLKGIQQISEEGAIQVFKQPNIGVETLTVGVVGMLQFEVLEYRMKNEYGVDIDVHNLPYNFARWVMTDKVTKDMLGYMDSAIIVEDKNQRPVILFKDKWALKRTQDNNKGIEFLEMPPQT